MQVVFIVYRQMAVPALQPSSTAIQYNMFLFYIFASLHVKGLTKLNISTNNTGILYSTCQHEMLVCSFSFFCGQYYQRLTFLILFGEFIGLGFWGNLFTKDALGKQFLKKKNPSSCHCLKETKISSVPVVHSMLRTKITFLVEFKKYIS